MTYLQFHLVFLIPQTLLLLGLALRVRPKLGDRFLLPLFGVPPLALLYTSLWDQYLIANAVWWYGADRVLGTWAGVPWEEYGFMLIQPVLTGSLLLVVLAGSGRDLIRPEWTQRRLIRAALAGMVIGGLALGVGLFALGRESGTYLGLILVWAGPPLAALTTASWRAIERYWRAVIGVWVAATLYLCVADRIAIGLGIWEISPTLSTGWMVAGLPFEEGLFFAITNALVVTGVLLFWLPGLPAEPKPGPGSSGGSVPG